MERSTIFNGKIHDFDWAIFNSFLYVHQRVRNMAIFSLFDESYTKKITKVMFHTCVTNNQRVNPINHHEPSLLAINHYYQLSTVTGSVINHCWSVSTTILHLVFVCIINHHYPPCLFVKFMHEIPLLLFFLIIGRFHQHEKKNMKCPSLKPLLNINHHISWDLSWDLPTIYQP